MNKKYGLKISQVGTKEQDITIIALALLGGREGLLVLRSMIRERDTFIHKDCRKNKGDIPAK